MKMLVGLICVNIRNTLYVILNYIDFITILNLKNKMGNLVKYCNIFFF